MPRPGTVAYKDHVMAIHLTDLEADGRPLTETDAMVYMRSMTDNVWTAAARYRPGESVTLRLTAWSDVADRYEGINRSELDDAALQLVEPCWGEAVKNMKYGFFGKRCKKKMKRKGIFAILTGIGFCVSWP